MKNISDKKILKSIEFLTIKDQGIKVGAYRICVDLKLDSKEDIERENNINYIDGKLIKLFQKGLVISGQKNLNSNLPNPRSEYSLTKEGFNKLSPFYKKIPWWALVIALISGLAPTIFNFISKYVKNN